MSSQVVVELLEANEWQRLRSIRLEALTESEHAFGGTLEAESVEDEISWRNKFEKLDFLIASVDGVDAALLSVEVLDGDFGGARKLSTVTYEEMLELAASGAKVLHLRCVEYARRYELPIHVRSSFSNKEGTWVVKDHPEGGEMEQAIIAGIAHDKSEAKVTIVGVPDRTGVAAAIFQAIADADINIDMIVQNVSAAATGLTDISFTLPKTEGANATAVLKRIQGEIGFASIQYDDQIGKLSLIGAGMRSHPGVTATFFACLSEAGVNIEMISTSEIRISIVCRNTDLEKGVKAAHTAFDLDADQIEAVVYGGSGR